MPEEQHEQFQCKKSSLQAVSSASSISESIIFLPMESYYVVLQLLECYEKLINVYSHTKK